MGTADKRDRRLELIGHTLEGRYRIESLLGVGGMGLVFKAHHVQLRRDVAVKVLNASAAGDDEATARFMREAESAARLDHENCLRVYDFGVTQDGIHYMVMPILDGENFATLVPGNLPPRRVVELGIELFAGLQHAHERDVIHRDLKPQNLFTRTGADGVEHLVIADFGVAKILEGGDPEQATRSGYVVGTPAYMSPEQASGMEIDARSDLFSAGLILWRLLTGSVPLRARNNLDQIRVRAALDVPTLPDDFPQELRSFCAELCARDRDKRLATAREARERLEAIRDEWSGREATWDEPVITSQEPAASYEQLASGTTALSSTEQRRASRRWWPAVAAGVIGGMGLAWWGLSTVEPTSAPATAAVATPEPAPEPIAEVPVAAPDAGSAQDEDAAPAPDALEKLALVNRGDLDEALPYDERHALLRELEADPKAVPYIDRRVNLGLDLLQAGQAPEPCRTFGDALRAIDAARDRGFLEVLSRAKVPRAAPSSTDGAQCKGLARELARSKKRLERRERPRPQAAPKKGSDKGPRKPSTARPVKVTEKLDG